MLEPIYRESRLAGMGSETEYVAMARSRLCNRRLRGPERTLSRTWTICAGRLVRKLLTDGTYRVFLLDARARNRAFLFTVLRLQLAYRLGSKPPLRCLSMNPFKLFRGSRKGNLVCR